MQALTLTAARAIAGTLSDTSKMPGKSASLSALKCITGGKLAQKAGSVCAICYALRNNYTWPSVGVSMDRRQQGLTHPQWTDAMVTLISRAGSPWFRWFDSGDLQSMDHLRNILDVCRRTPDVAHWLATKEAQFVRQLQPDDVPDNLVLRLSSPMIDQRPVSWWPWTSTVVSDGDNASCPAKRQGNSCGECRACWDGLQLTVSYPEH